MARTPRTRLGNFNARQDEYLIKYLYYGNATNTSAGSINISLNPLNTLYTIMALGGNTAYKLMYQEYMMKGVSMKISYLGPTTTSGVVLDTGTSLNIYCRWERNNNYSGTIAIADGS